MTTFTDPKVRGLLEPANHATISTVNGDGSIHSAVVWMSLEDGQFAVNGAQGRLWCNNLESNANVTVLVYADGQPYEYVEVRGTTTATRQDADDHIDRLAKRYIGEDRYPFRQEGEVRLKFPIEPSRIRYLKQG